MMPCLPSMEFAYFFLIIDNNRAILYINAPGKPGIAGGTYNHLDNICTTISSATSGVGEILKVALFLFVYPV